MVREKKVERPSGSPPHPPKIRMLTQRADAWELSPAPARTPNCFPAEWSAPVPEPPPGGYLASEPAGSLL